MSWKLLQGDVMAKLAEIETGTVQTCITSPPYWGLRDYGVDGQIGLEKTPEEYVNKMVEVFREVRRVLRDDGTLWLNLGDSYASGGMSNPSSKSTLGGGKDLGAADYSITHKVPNGLKPKDLVGIPWRVAFALQADGWYLRSDIIWAKPNPMPESVTDRPTKAHEYLFLLSKSDNYYYDAEAIKEPANYPEGSWARSKCYDGDETGKLRSFYGNGKKWEGAEKRNKRSVWTVATKPYPESHFATFPPKLIEPCILAGSSPKACEKCGAPWERVVEKTPNNKGYSKKGPGGRKNVYEKHHGTLSTVARWDTTTTGWQPTCTCQNEGKGRCIVLDPFAGTGTTLWVAEHFGRDSIGIEISEEYCRLINKRMSNRQMTLFERGADL